MTKHHDAIRQLDARTDALLRETREELDALLHAAAEFGTRAGNPRISELRERTRRLEAKAAASYGAPTGRIPEGTLVVVRTDNGGEARGRTEGSTQVTGDASGGVSVCGSISLEGGPTISAHRIAGLTFL